MSRSTPFAFAALSLFVGCGARTGFLLDELAPLLEDAGHPQPNPGGPNQPNPPNHPAPPGHVVLFGGVAAKTVGDTWIFDGSKWTESQSSQSPPARGGAAIAYSGVATYLFGGDRDGVIYGDTWKWNGSSWEQEPHVAAPQARVWVAMAPMPGASAIVLFGGEEKTFTPLNDTWTWKNGWTLASPVSLPNARRFHTMAPLGDRIVLFGGSVPPSTKFGDAWIWDGATWTPAPASAPAGPPARDEHAMATIGNKVMLFGGLSNADIHDLADTWTYDGSHWSEEHPPVSPSPRHGHAMASLNGAIVLFGGMDSKGASLGDTWIWDGSTWTEVTPSPSPPARWEHAMATSP